MVEKKRVGEPCPKCGAPLIGRPNSMAFRGRSFTGCYCGACNALWDNADDSIFSAAEDAAFDERATPLVWKNFDGSVTLKDPSMDGVMRAVAKHNCRWTFRQAATHVERLRLRMVERGDDPAVMCIVIANVDDPHGGALVDGIMPGHDWARIRAKGEIPMARGIVGPRDVLLDGVRIFDPEAAEKLATLAGALVLVIDHGVAEVFQVPA